MNKKQSARAGFFHACSASGLAAAGRIDDVTQHGWFCRRGVLHILLRLVTCMYPVAMSVQRGMSATMLVAVKYFEPACVVGQTVWP